MMDWTNIITTLITSGAWRDRCDKLGSKIAYYRAFECRKSKCPDREPPFGSGVFADEARCGRCASQNAEN